MTKLKATLIHLSLSILIFITFFSVLIIFWFPSPLFVASGGAEGLKIVAGIDLVLGPLLTLILFNRKKPSKELKIDLSLIVVIQVAALTWGVFTIFSQRPVAMVFWDDTFYAVPASVLTQQDYNLTKLKEFSPNLPALIYAEVPKDKAQAVEFLRKMKEDHIPPHHQTNLYQRFSPSFDLLKHKQVDINEIIQKNKKMEQALIKILSENGQTKEDFIYLPLKSFFGNIILMFDHDGSLKNHLVVLR
jgi:hypothetical protein